VPKRVYDFVDSGGRNVISEWLLGLDKALVARVESKLDVLLTAEDDLPPKMVTDTALTQIKELRINSKEALRILLCKGPDPSAKNEEITLLFGAAERDKKYVPKDALARAEKNRQLILQDPNAHRNRRMPDANP
jgi:hypothetical protein